MFLRSLRRPTTKPAVLAVLAGLILLAPAAYGQGGLTAPAGLEATPATATLDESATVKRFDQLGARPELGNLADPAAKGFTVGWTDIMFEGGGDFPGGNGWNVFDGDAASGEDYWDDLTCRPFAGNWSIWCADIGDSTDCVEYDNDMNSWAIFGPFSLADAEDARAEFAAWSEVEDTFDSLFIGASINGSNFFGATLSQDFDWTVFEFDLTNVFTLGDLTGQPSVWLAFVFDSDSSVAFYEGVYLDDIYLEKRVDDGTCFADATTLCLPGDDRFEVSVYFETTQGSGSMGNATAISLDSIGITKGGIFAFSDPANPEFLVKILDGCSINNHWWVFYAATTNVGFDLTVTDTMAAQTKVYTNPDVHAATTITDTQAFATCP